MPSTSIPSIVLIFLSSLFALSLHPIFHLRNDNSVGKTSSHQSRPMLRSLSEATTIEYPPNTKNNKNDNGTNNNNIISEINNTIVVPFTTRRIAIARTFCEVDAMDLLSSFDVWDDLPPCEEKPIVPVDIFLSYSRDLEQSARAREAVEAVRQRFYETNGWNGCFDKFVAFGTNIPESQDLYRPREQPTNVNWVNGPNRQFERTIRVISNTNTLGDGSLEDYELMYLMEGDSVPMKPFWLNAIMSEIEDMQPFAILGSRYRGDKWDQFYNQLPSSLIHHTNGNAVYNITHPFFLHLLDELEREAKTPANSIAFDHRMQQIIQEGVTGVPSEQLEFEDTEPLADKTALFQQWVDEYPPDEVIKESSVNVNYAATNMVKELVSDSAFVIHGAKMYSSWNSTSHGEISLVVSDWHEQNYRQVLAGLDESTHPFSKVVIMQPEDVVSPSSTHEQTTTPVHIHRRGKDPDFMDFCSAPVKTEWFMITNSYFRLRPVVTMMIDEKKGSVYRPIVSTVEADATSCFNHKSCVQDMSIARHFLPQMKQVFQADNTLFKTSVRDEFCEKLNFLPVSDHLIATPATAYMAYLEAEGGGIQNVYKLSDRKKDGSRFAFVPFHVNTLPLTMANQHRRNLQEATNETICTPLTTEEECISNACLWNADFSSCRDTPISYDDIEEVNTTSVNKTHQLTNTLTGMDLLNMTDFGFTNQTEFEAYVNQLLSGNFSNTPLNMGAFSNMPGFNHNFTGDLSTLFSNATTIMQVFGSADNFVKFFTDFAVASEMLSASSPSSSAATTAPAGTAPAATEPPVEAEVDSGPKMCTIKILVGGDTVDTIQIPCP